MRSVACLVSIAMFMVSGTVSAGQFEDAFGPANAAADLDVPLDDADAPKTELDAASTGPPTEVYGPPAPDVMIEVPAGIPGPLALGVTTALADYPTIRAGRLNERARDIDIEAAKGGRFPSVSLQALSFAGGSSAAGSDPFAANLVVDQPLWAGGRIDAQIDRARAARLVSSAELTETAEALSIQTINAYYETVLGARRMTQLSDGNDQLNDLIASIRRRVEQKVSPSSELVLAQSRQAEIERQYNFAQATYFSSREIFRQLTGLYSYEFEELPDYDGRYAHPATQDALLQAGQCSPALKRLNAEAELARTETELAEKQLFPILSAQFSQNEVTGARVGLALTAQLNNGLSQFATIRASRVRELEAGAEIDAASRDTRLRLTNDLLLNYSTRDQIPVSRRSVRAAQEITASYRRQFTAGRKTWLEVVNAVREEITADLGLVDAETSAMASAARIMIYTCRWSPAIGGR